MEFGSDKCAALEIWHGKQVANRANRWHVKASSYQVVR